MTLTELLDIALDRRRALLARCAAEHTDAYRVFHGGAEGQPGLTLDRYGALVLAQTFRAPLADAELAELRAWTTARLAPVAGAELQFAWNHRGDGAHPGVALTDEFVCRERGVKLAVRARHRGQDPGLFLDLRPARARIAELAPGKSMLNLFAYTCGAGIVAAAAGAREVWNVDFAQSALDVGVRNLELNGLDPERMRFVDEDCLPVMWQLAGLAVKGRGSFRPHQKFDARRFDIVFLDPPAWSKGPFGAVDVVRDYAGVFKPALLATEDGGVIVATNHVAEVHAEDWVAALGRCATKCGRPLASVESFGPDEDFPSFDARAPLKVALCRLAPRA